MQQIKRCFRSELCKRTDHSLELSGHKVIKVFKHDGAGLIMQETIYHYDKSWELLSQSLHLIDFDLLGWGEYRFWLIFEVRSCSFRLIGGVNTDRFH